MMRNERGYLFVVTGASGSGKGTILKELLKNRDDVFLSISATTRHPRPGEVHGKNYLFVSQEDFKTQIERDEMLEYACYCGNFYGTPRRAVQQHLEAGNHVILEIEVQGAMKIKERFPEACFVFLTPPSLSILRERLIGRGTESADEIDKRLSAAQEEYKFVAEYDHIVINDDIERAARELSAIIDAFKSKTEHRIDYIQGEFYHAVSGH